MKIWKREKLEKKANICQKKLISDHLLGADLSSCAAGSWRPDVLVLVVQHLQEYCGYCKQHLVKYYCYCYCKQHPPHHYLKCYCFCYCKQHFKSVRERIITLQSTITASRRSWAVRVGHRWVETWSVFFLQRRLLIRKSTCLVEEIFERFNISISMTLPVFDKNENKIFMTLTKKMENILNQPLTELSFGNHSYPCPFDSPSFQKESYQKRLSIQKGLFHIPVYVFKSAL